MPKMCQHDIYDNFGSAICHIWQQENISCRKFNLLAFKKQLKNNLIHTATLQQRTSAIIPKQRTAISHFYNLLLIGFSKINSVSFATLSTAEATLLYLKHNPQISKRVNNITHFLNLKQGFRIRTRHNYKNRQHSLICKFISNHICICLSNSLSLYRGTCKGAFPFFIPQGKRRCNMT